MSLIPRPGSGNPIIFDLGPDQPTRPVSQFRPVFLSSFGMYDQSRRRLLATGDSLRRITLQTKERVFAFVGISLTTLRTAASWASVFQREVGRLGYLALSGMIAAVQAAMASHEGLPGVQVRQEDRPRRDVGISLGEYTPLDPNEITKVQKEIADIFNKAKAAKLPETKSSVKPTAAAKSETSAPTVVAKKSAAPSQPSVPPKPPPLDKVTTSPNQQEKTTVSLFVTRPAATKSPLRIHLLVEGA